MQNYKITKILAVILLIIVFNITCIEAAVAASAPLPDESLRTEAKILHYSDPKNTNSREACLAVVDGIRAFHNGMGNLPIVIMRGHCSVANFTDVLVGIKNKLHQSVEEKLQNVSGEEKARAIAFFDEACQRVLEIYQPFGERISTLFNRFSRIPINCSGGTATRIPGYDYPILLTAGHETEQCSMLEDLLNLKSEMKIAGAWAPWVYRLDNFQLFLYIANVNSVQIDDSPTIIRKPAISKLYAAYGEKTLKGKELATLEYAAVADLRIDTVVVPGVVEFTLAASSDGYKVSETFIGDNTQIVAKETILASGGPKMPTVSTDDSTKSPTVKAVETSAMLKHFPMFTEEDEETLEGIMGAVKEAEFTIKRFLDGNGVTLEGYKAPKGKTPNGYSKNETLMEYGRTSGGIVLISNEVRQKLSNSLKTQLKRRDMTPLPFKEVTFEERILVGMPAAVAILKNWIKELKILANTESTERSLNYIQVKYPQSPCHSKLLQSLWTLRQIHSKYSKWPKEDEKAKLLEGMLPLLTQSLAHLEEHAGMCGIGAEGRAFLIDLGTLNFFKDVHPNLAVAA